MTLRQWCENQRSSESRQRLPRGFHRCHRSNSFTVKIQGHFKREFLYKLPCTYQVNGGLQYLDKVVLMIEVIKMMHLAGDQAPPSPWKSTLKIAALPFFVVLVCKFVL